MRVTMGDIPKVTSSVSFFDLFGSDKKTGAKVLKHPSELRALFEKLQGMKFDLLHDEDDSIN